MSRTPTRSLSPTKPTSSLLPLRPSSAMPLNEFISNRTARNQPFQRGQSWSNQSADDSYQQASPSAAASSSSKDSRNIFDASTNLSMSSLDRTKQDLQAFKLPLPPISRLSAKESPQYDEEDQDMKGFDEFAEEEEEEKYEDEEYAEAEEVPGGYDNTSEQEYAYQDVSKDEYGNQEEGEEYDEDGYLRQPYEQPYEQTSPTGDNAPTSTGSLWSDDSVSIADRTFNKGFIAPTPPQSSQQQGTQRNQRLDVGRAQIAQRRFGIARPEPVPQRPTRIPSPPRPRAYEDADRTIRPRTPDGDRTIRPGSEEERRALSPTERAIMNRPASPPVAQDQTGMPLLTDEELSSITSFSALLETLQDRQLNSQAQAPQNMELELENLVKYNYGNKDKGAPTKFFTELPDASYEEAGEVLLGRKRDIEQKLQEAARKRRKVVDEGAEEIRSVAEDTVKRLALLKEKREQLKGGVGLLLRQSGLGI